MADPCRLTGCAQRTLGKSSLQQPIDANVLMPWVKIWVYDSNDSIHVGANVNHGELGVGNQSEPTTGNRAIIKSFQIGMSSGVGARIEIIDELGGDFQKFFQRFMKNNAVDSNNLLKCVWGWTGQKCNGGIGPPQVLATSKVHTLFFASGDVNIENGLFHFTITATDMVNMLEQTRETVVLGPCYTTEAIDELLFQRYGIPVQYLTIDPQSGQSQALQFLSDRTNRDPDRGYFGIYSTDNKTPLQAARGWMDEALDQNGYGTYVYWDTTQSTPTLVFCSNIRPTCSDLIGSNRIIRTYVVNGGVCSPVLSFRPYIRWNLAPGRVRTGSQTDAALGVNERAADCTGKQPNLRNGQPAPGNTPSVVDGNPRITDAWGRHASPNYDRVTAPNYFANNVIWEPITAELVVQGDPGMGDITAWQGHFVGLVFFNPYYIDNTGPTGCDWAISSPPCNSVLSNSNWWIQGVEHNIREGSYTTTYKLLLAAPGFDSSLPATLGLAPVSLLLSQI